MEYNTSAMKRSLCLCVLVSLFLLPAVASAQVNLSGVWDNLGILHEDWPDRLFGPELGDYTGIPLNDAARFRADAWDASLITLPEYQCRVHPSDYVPSFAAIRIWEERDKDSQQPIAIHTHHFAWGTERTIWMDGRPHPDRSLRAPREVGWRYPDGQHHASERRLDSPQRCSPQR